MDDLVRAGFPKLLTPNVNVIPYLTIKVSIDGTEMSEVFTISQKALTPKNLSAINIDRNRGYIGPTGNDYNYNRYYNLALWTYNVFGPNGLFYTPNNFSVSNADWGAANTSSITASTNHVNANHVNGISVTTAARINNWRDSGEGILVINDDYHGSNTATTGGFATGKLYNLLSWSYATRSGSPRINTGASHTKVYKYIFVNGPFGPVDASSITDWSYDDERLAIGGYPPSAVPIVTDGAGNAHILIDPQNRVVFNGELQFFNSARYQIPGTGPVTEYQKFLANYIAFIHNVAMYGSHFTDHFRDETDTNPPFDYKP